MGLAVFQENDHSSNGLIPAKHSEELYQETPEEIAKKFNGTCSRLSAGGAAFVYWKAGGLLLGIFSLAIFMLTQTVRIVGDWWIR